MKFGHALRLGTAATAATATAVLGVAWGASAATPTTVNGFNAAAYGSYLTGFGAAVKSGPTALTTLGCTTKTGITTRNSTAAVTVPALGTFGAVTSTTSTAAITGGVRDNATSTIGKTTLLRGLVSASAIHSNASAKNVKGVRSTTAGASLTSLMVAGHAVTVKPNLTMKLTVPGASTPFATAVFNEQAVSRTATRISVTERAIDIRISGSNSLNLPIGSRIVVGYSQATLAPGVQGLLGGDGYATKAAAGATVKSDATAYLAQSCLGSSGTNRVASVSNGLFGTGAAVTHVVGTIGATAADTRTTDQIAKVNVLGGAVTADSITAAAHAHATNGVVALDTTGSGFTHLKVLGHAINSATVQPNTKMNLPGIGQLTLRKTDTSNASGLHHVAVTMVQVAILSGSKAGTTITISTASASIRR